MEDRTEINFISCYVYEEDKYLKMTKTVSHQVDKV